MFDIGFWELCLIGVVALLVLGPERLPRAARAAGLWIGKARRAIAEVQAEIQRELDLEDLEHLGRAPPAIPNSWKNPKQILKPIRSGQFQK